MKTKKSDIILTSTTHSELAPEAAESITSIFRVIPLMKKYKANHHPCDTKILVTI